MLLIQVMKAKKTYRKTLILTLSNPVNFIVSNPERSKERKILMRILISLMKQMKRVGMGQSIMKIYSAKLRAQGTN